jgi:Asp-tRNA(Asn)/Glu-tRNA(Gln) amidotransferase A subunit family amidase
LGIAELYEGCDAVGLAQLVRRGQVTPTELLDEALGRVGARDGQINSIVVDLEHRARAGIAAGLPDGPFTGVPFLVKDLNTNIEGELSTEGSRFFADRRADVTSEIVRRFDRAGLVIFAKTNSPELGLSPTTEPVLHGPTRNPWNRDRSAGGSSGGAGAAVAAGIVPMAHATDGGGSIRIPASANGLFGLKPTRGRTPIGPPLGEGWNGLSIGHVVSRSVRDSAVALDAIAGSSVGEPYSAPAPPGAYAPWVDRPPGRLRIAVSTTGRPGIDVDPVCVEAVEQAAALLEELGHRIEPANPPIDWDLMAQVQSTIISAHVACTIHQRATELGREPGPDDLEPLALAQYRRAADETAIDYARADQAQQVLSRRIGAFFETIDVLVTPTLGSAPVPIGSLVGSMEELASLAPALSKVVSFLGVYNVTGQPAMSMPLHHSSDGLPIGVQLVGRFGAEHTLFALAGQLERATPWWSRRPDPWW